MKIILASFLNILHRSTRLILRKLNLQILSKALERLRDFNAKRLGGVTELMTEAVTSPANIFNEIKQMKKQVVIFFIQ